MSSYKEKLLDPRWQRKRLEILERSGFACEACADTTSTLHVHHKRYVKGREPWDYSASELVSLCKNCHSGDHDARQAIDELLALAAPHEINWDRLVGLIAGFVFTCSNQDIDSHLVKIVREHAKCEPGRLADSAFSYKRAGEACDAIGTDWIEWLQSHPGH